MERPSFPSQPASAYASSSSTNRNTIVPPRRETASAPIPSPTVQQGQFFAAFSSQPQSQQAPTSYPYQQQSPLYQNPQQQAPYTTQQSYGQAQQQQQQQQPAGQANYQYNPDRTGAGATAQETSGFIKDYALVAEAAKRAQMAVMMRDFGEVELR
jgi:hypothetical protein